MWWRLDSRSLYAWEEAAYKRNMAGREGVQFLEGRSGDSIPTWGTKCLYVGEVWSPSDPAMVRCEGRTEVAREYPMRDVYSLGESLSWKRGRDSDVMEKWSDH